MKLQSHALLPRSRWPRRRCACRRPRRNSARPTSIPEDYPTVMAVKLMSDTIKQKTGGKHSIKVFTGNQLGGEKDTIEQTRSARSTSCASTSRR